jgi:O-antigen/teichoic acid export membrane protein
MIRRPNDRQQPAPGAALPATMMLVGASVTSAGLGYLWTIVTGRLLPAAEYADFSASASIIYFAATALAPCAQTMAYFTASYIGAGHSDAAFALERRALRFIALAGLLVLIAAAAASSPLAASLHFRSRLTLLLAVASAAGAGVLHIKRGRLLGQQQFRGYSWNLIIESIVRLLVAVLLLLLAASAAGSVGAYAAALLAAMALAGWQKGAVREIDMQAVRRYFAPVFAYTIIYAGFQNIDVLIVKRLFPPAEAGMYGAASLLARAAGMLVMPFVAFAVPHLVEVLHDAAEIRRRFARIVVQYIVLAAIAVTVLGLGSRVIISMLFGREYGPAARLLLPLSAAIALSGLVFLLCQLPVATNRFAFVKWYAFGLLIELAALATFHRTLLDIPLVLIVTNAIALVLMIPHLRVRTA